MENASKALIMAASVLIGIMILSIAVYLFVTFGASSKQIHQEIDINRLNEFNSQFTSYEGKNDNTIYDIISVTNLAIENNTYYDLSTPDEKSFYITVNAKIYKSNSKTQRLETLDDDELKNLAKNEIMIKDTEPDGTVYKKLPTYSCEVTISKTTGRVSKVEFAPNNN